MGLLDAALSRIGLSRSSEVASLRAEVDGLSRRMYRERRASGVEIQSGSFEYEVNAGLRGDKRWQAYAKMVTDPHVKGALRFNVLPLLAAEWDVAPGGEEERDVEIAEFVKANLLRMPCDKYGREFYVRTSWRQRLYEILDMLESGYAMFSKSTRIQGAKLIYDELKWLEPSSVDPRGWKLGADDTIVKVERTFTDPTLRYHVQEPIPAEQISLYVWELRGARFEGVPFIRSMYGPWYRKDFITRMASIWAQKTGAGVPVGSYPEGWPDEVREKFVDFIKSLRGTAPAEAYGVFPKGADGTEATWAYAGSETGEVDRMRGLIDGENAEIAHAGGTKGMLLGETQTGSRALGQTLGATEFLFLQAIVECICDFANHGVGTMAGEVQELVDWNYAGVKKYPRLVCSKVHPDQALRHFDQVQKAFASGLLPKVPEARKIVADMLGFKLPDEVFEDDDAYEVRDPFAERRDNPAGNSPGRGRGSESRGDEDDGEAELALDMTALRERMSALLAPEEGAASPAAGFRRPTRIESHYCDLAAVSESFRVGERDIHNQLRDLRDAMIRDLMQRLRAGKITPRNLESQRRSRFRGFTKWAQRLTSTVERVGRDGMEHVEREVAAQRSGGRKALAASVLVALAFTMPRYARAFETEAELLGELNVGKMWDRMLSEFLGHYDAQRRQGVEGDALSREMQEFMDGLSDKSVQDQARQTAGVAYNEGRSAALQSAAASGAAQYVVRSEILDSSTCAECARLDGTIVEVQSPEFQALMPPARCQGGDRCRGFYVPITPEALA